ncbi:hypothetical protein [Alienimonas sp. DA493]|uniref:hypothetical protein n=1 Tax=Alienimonas sp. DA493 TaxID=3373605 RepID=UPI0037554025
MSEDNLTYAEELRIRRAIHDADFIICGPFFRHHLRSAGVDPKRVSHATVCRLSWEEIWVKLGDAMEGSEVIERQVMNEDEDWSRKFLPDIIGVRLKRTADQVAAGRPGKRII